MKKNVLTLILGIVMTFSLTQCKPSLDSLLKQAASEANKSCPVNIDKDTRLDNVSSLPDKQFQYSYTLVNYVKDSVNADELQKAIQPGILNQVKTNPDLKIFRDNKVTMIYSYSDKNKVFITKVNITPDLYESK
jgi:hypothetical protein